MVAQALQTIHKHRFKPLCCLNIVPSCLQLSCEHGGFR
jgi:hypothetical protein